MDFYKKANTFYKIFKNMELNKVFAFDTETIIDQEIASKVLNKTGDYKTIENEIKSYHLQYNNPFPRQMFWKIACLSYVEADVIRSDEGYLEYDVKNIKSAGNISANEEEIIKGFSDYCERKKPRLVTFNGKTFDIPVLKYRMMKYDMQMSWFYKKTGDDPKWAKDTYSDKWGDKYNLDLIDFFKAPSGGVKMLEACAVFEIPVKVDVSGGGVSELYIDGKIEEIRNYCEHDAMATYLLFLISSYHKGELSDDGYVSSMQNFFIKLSEYKENHLLQFFNLCKESKFLSRFIQI